MTAIQTGVVYCEDNLQLIGQLPDECIDLVYMDPPFFTGRRHEAVRADEVRAFADQWSGIEVYLDWMRDRVEQIHRLLKPTGSVYLHCDPTASHYLKVLLDTIFGVSRFRNEIVWQRTLAKGQAKKRLPSNHDLLLVYAKAETPTWNEDAVLVPYNTQNRDERTASKYSHKDSSGRLYQLTSLIAPSHDRPNLTYEFLGVTRVWRWTESRMREAHDKGLIVQTKPGRVPRFKRYLDEQRGKALGDVWTDIPPINSRAAERLGYPTQKPEALLERIIAASSREDDVVLDPCCGSGTTLAVAQRMGRQWIGIDDNPAAVALTRTRLSQQQPSLFGLAVTP